MKWKFKRKAGFPQPQSSEKIGYCLIPKSLGIIRNSRQQGENTLILLWSWLPAGYCHRDVLPQTAKALENIVYLCLLFPSPTTFWHLSLHSTKATRALWPVISKWSHSVDLKLFVLNYQGVDSWYLAQSSWPPGNFFPGYSLALLTPAVSVLWSLVTDLGSYGSRAAVLEAFIRHLALSYCLWVSTSKAPFPDWFLSLVTEHCTPTVYKHCLFAYPISNSEQGILWNFVIHPELSPPSFSLAA